MTDAVDEPNCRNDIWRISKELLQETCLGKRGVSGHMVVRPRTQQPASGTKQDHVYNSQTTDRV